MFQRRMIFVASRLQNVNLTAPQLCSKKQHNQEQPTNSTQPHNVQNNSSTTIEQDGGISTERIGNLGRSRRYSNLSDFDALNMKKKSVTQLNHHSNPQKQRLQSCCQTIRHNFIYVAFILYLVLGTLFYMLDPGNEKNGVLAYYQAITIGFSVGLGTKDPDFVPNVWFSSFYILCGAAIIAVMLTQAGNQIEEAASMTMFESLQRRENYENQMTKENPLRVRICAFLAYNSAYLICILVWLLWMGFIMVWAVIHVPEWDFGHAQYFAVSLCSSAGSFSLPTTSSDMAYGLAGLSMMVGVPLMAIGVSSVIIMLWQGHRFQKVKMAAWEDVTQEELHLLNELGVVDMGEGDELTKGGFILLGLLRMGQEVGVMKYLADAFDTIEDRGGVIIRKTNSINGREDGGYYSKHAQAYIGCECSKDEVGDMEDFTSTTHRSDTSTGATSLSHTSTTVTAATPESGRDGNGRSWSISGIDSSTSRNFSGLSEIMSSGNDSDDEDHNHHLDPINETSPSLDVQEDDNDSIPRRREDSTIGNTV